MFCHECGAVLCKKCGKDQMCVKSIAVSDVQKVL
jgi:hypothetical protein